MIYIYTYLIISLFITMMTAIYMKERFGHLTYFVEYIRMFSDEQTSDYLKDYTNKQIVGAYLMLGFLLSPIIAVWVMFRGGVRMVVTFKDLKTGQIAKSDYPFSIYWWAEGNGSCNCNRQLLFGIEDLDCHTDYDWDNDLQRFQAIDIEDHPEQTIEQALLAVNEDVCEQCHLKTKEDILKAINRGLYV